MRRSLSLLTLAGLFACSEAPLPSTMTEPDAGQSNLSCDDANPCADGFVCRSGVCEEVVPDAGPEGRGAVRVMPEALDFGAFQLGTTVQLSLTVENVGDADLELLALEIEDNPSQEFRLDTGGTLPKTLAPGEVHAARVLYTAADGQDDYDRLRVVTDDREQPVLIVPLTAEYKGISEIVVVRDAASVQPEVVELDFGATPLGTQSEATLFIKNVGTGNAVLNVQSVRTEPNPSLVYAVQTSTGVPYLLGKFRSEALCTDGQCDLPDTMCVDGLCLDASGAPVDTLAVQVTFTPGRVGLLEERLIIGNDDADEGTYTVRLVGEGIQASLQVQPDPIDLGTVFVGFATTTQVSLQSIGDDRITVIDAALVAAPSGLSLTTTSSLPRSLSPGGTLTATLTADPVAAGLITGVLRVESTDLDLPIREVPLRGEVLIAPQIRTSSPALSFGEVHVFRGPGQSVTQVITVSNEGGSALVFTAVGLSSQSSPDFSVTPGAGATLNPGDSQDFTVSYHPTVLGPDTGSLVFSSNDPAQPQLEVPLSGEGTDPTLFLFKSTVPPIPASPIDFGPVYRGSAAPQVTLTIQNVGVGQLIVQGLAPGAGSSPDFILSNGPTLPARVASGGTVTLDVTFAPGSVGVDTGAIEIVSNDRDAALTIVSLTGEGVGCAANLWDLDNDPSNGCEYACVQATPPVEACNGADDDCNGSADEGFSLGAMCNGVGQCGGGVIECTPDGSGSTCSTNPGQSQSQDVAEVCNTFDDDCDGVPDNGFNLQADLLNCGACGTACSVANGSPVCASGNCAVDSCTTNFDDCNGQYPDGCEANLLVDLSNCGACNTACGVANGTPVCNSGQCAVAGCTTGFFDCNGQYPDGCEADLNNSVTTCGSCSTQCAVANGSPNCASGQCGIASCVAPWSDCNSQYVDGCETNTTQDTAHCGQCGAACSVANGSPACTNGACGVASCTAPFLDCNGQYADGCEANLSNTVATCGSCNTSCTVANGTPDCTNSTCGVASCTAPFSDCNGQYGDGCETNLSNNVLSCGFCGNACVVANGAPRCSGGGCSVASCTAPWLDCNGQYGDGCEANTANSLAHCGGCNQPCAVANGTPTCNSGSCQVQSCTAPFVDCNGAPGDGCEINTGADALNCGFCGNACNLANATPSCSGGACAIAQCTAPFSDCNGLAADGCESDLNNDLATCGGCNTPCDFANASESCNSGVCTFTGCQTGFVDLDGNTANGCEYQCTPGAGVDLPDGSFIDRDCDGIDGDLSVAIFVSPLGSDVNTGLFGSPVRSIAAGLNRAAQRGFVQVLVAGGFYNELVNVSDGIGLYAGYDPLDWSSRSYSNATVISGGASGSSLFGVRAQNLVLSTRVDGFTVTVGNNNQASGSVYGVYARNVGSNLVLSNLTVSTGRGGDGNPGSNGASGMPGGGGSVGQAGCDGCSGNGNGGSGGSSACGRPGGGGGRGGHDNASGVSGTRPSGGGSGGGGGPGAQVCDSGACSSCAGRKGGVNGSSGNLGSTGTSGARGAGGLAAGALSSNLWLPGAGGNGVSGTAGAGGGGGGGGGGGADDCYANVFACLSTGNPCNADRGGGGGGGGAGGCGGTRGTAGGGGGGSFGIFLVSASPVIEACTVSAGRGGDGGAGGRGGSGGGGGSGGSGGSGQDDSGNGASGASGRPGGSGGHGGGGAGGASFAIYRASGSSPSLSANTLSATAGAQGGGGPGNSGQAGASNSIF